MYFRKEEKVFSLSGTSGIILRDDLTALWSEFFCYLLVYGFYAEGNASTEYGIFESSNTIADGLSTTCTTYHESIGRRLVDGLKDRYFAILNHGSLTPAERQLLEAFNHVFSAANPLLSEITGRKIVTVAATRGFSTVMTAVAHHVAVMYGQKDFVASLELPRLYLSKFGNIHLSAGEAVKLGIPTLVFGERHESGLKVTPLWAYLSAVAESPLFCDEDYNGPGDKFTNYFADLTFLTERSFCGQIVTLPQVVAATRVQMHLDIYQQECRSLTATFYQEFLYGRAGNLTIVNHPLYLDILDVMMNKMGCAYLSSLFAIESPNKRWLGSATIYGSTPPRSALLNYALEALDSDLEPAKDPESPEVITDDDAGAAEDSDPNMDPSTESGGFDPSTPPPAAPLPQQDDKDTIGLISFDKTGEGIDEDLYRRAVVALNDRIQSDDSLPITPKVKESLNQWVGGWMYRTAIGATKDQISSLGLKKYLEEVPTKG